MDTRIVILEGADGAGKTTLMHKLADTVRFAGAHLVHFSNYPNVSRSYQRFYLEGMMPALLGHSHVIMDRSWLSEEPYAKAFRGGGVRFGREDCRMLERIALTRRAVIVHCDPGWDRCRSSFMSRKSEEYLDDVKQLSLVHQLYPDRIYESGLPAVAYDYVKHDFDTFFKRLLDVEGGLGYPPYYGDPPRGVGVPSTDSIVLVGESFATPGEFDCHHQFPFVSFQDRGFCRPLARDLEKNLIPEAELWWVNADQIGEPGSEEGQATARYLTEVKHVIALGDVASQCLEGWGIKHRKQHHPAYWYRFRLNRPYPLMQELKEIVYAR